MGQNLSQIWQEIEELSITLDPEQIDYIKHYAFVPGFERPKILAQKFPDMEFPLTGKDLLDCARLLCKARSAGIANGLAAPQINIAKRMVTFACPQSHADILRKFRKDPLTQFMEQVIWVNPSYEGIEQEGMSEDMEACLSVADAAGSVPRYQKIKVKAQSVDGSAIHIEVDGFLARLIQHEIDHIDGILFIDVVKDQSSLVSLESYREERKKLLEA